MNRLSHRILIMSHRVHMMIMLLFVTSAAIAQQRSWNIYDSTNIGIRSFMPTHVAGDTLYGSLDMYPFAIPVTSIERITIPHGNYFVQGTLVGGTLGLVAGLIYELTNTMVRKTLEAIQITPKKNEESQAVVAFTIGGALLGGLIGIAIPEQEVITFNGSTASVRIDRINNLLQRTNN